MSRKGNSLIDRAAWHYRQVMAERVPGSTEEEPTWLQIPHLIPCIWGMTDLTGHRFGKLTVLGYLGCKIVPAKDRIRHFWLVYCDCGRLEQRPNRVLLRGKLPGHCQQCELNHRVRYYESLRRR